MKFATVLSIFCVAIANASVSQEDFMKAVDCAVLHYDLAADVASQICDKVDLQTLLDQMDKATCDAMLQMIKTKYPESEPVQTLTCSHLQEFLDSLKSQAECIEALRMIISEANGQAIENLQCKPDKYPSNTNVNMPSGQTSAHVSIAGMDMEQLNEYVKGFNVIIEERKRTYEPGVIVTPGKRCRTDDDCEPGYECKRIEEGFKDLLEKNNDTKHFNFVKKTMSLDGNECSLKWGDNFNGKVKNLMPVLFNIFTKIQMGLNKTVGMKGFEKFIKKMKFISESDFDKMVVKPMTRSGYIDPPYAGGHHGGQPGGMDQSSLMLLLALSGRGSGDNSLLLLLAMSGGLGGMGGGIGGNLFSNPIMLSILFGNGGGNDAFSKYLPILLLSQSAGSGGAYGGSGPSDGLSFPLIFYLSMMGNSSDSLSSLLPFLLLSGNGFGGGGGGGGGFYNGQNYNGQNYNGQNYNGQNYNGQNYNGQNNQPYPQIRSGLMGGNNNLMSLLLISGLSGNTNTSLLPLLALSGSLGGGGGGMDPSLLLLLSGGSGLGNLGGGGGILDSKDPMLLYFLLSGLGSGGSGLDPSILLLLMGNSSLGQSGDILKLLFLSDPNFSDSPLSVLLFFGGLNFTANPNLLYYILFLTGGESKTKDPYYDYGFGGPGDYYGPGNEKSGFSSGMFQILLILMMTSGGSMDMTTLFLLSSMMQQDPEPDFYQQPYNAPQPYNQQPYNPQPYNPQPYNPQPYNPQPYNQQPYNPQPYYPLPPNPQPFNPPPYNPIAPKPIYVSQSGPNPYPSGPQVVPPIYVPNGKR